MMKIVIIVIGIRYELNDPYICAIGKLIEKDRNMEILTMRISDHDGKWADNYDSVFLSKTELDNGAYLKNTPIMVLKEYEQQIPLSYHLIDKKYLKEKYDADGDYLIM